MNSEDYFTKSAIVEPIRVPNGALTAWCFSGRPLFQYSNSQWGGLWINPWNQQAWTPVQRQSIFQQFLDRGYIKNRITGVTQTITMFVNPDEVTSTSISKINRHLQQSLAKNVLHQYNATQAIRIQNFRLSQDFLLDKNRLTQTVFAQGLLVGSKLNFINKVVLGQLLHESITVEVNNYIDVQQSQIGIDNTEKFQQKLNTVLESKDSTKQWRILRLETEKNFQKLERIQASQIEKKNVVILDLDDRDDE